jgi:hypothetical protein
MFRFNIATKAPIPCEIAGKVYQLPRFTRADWRAWGAKIDAENEERATAHLNPQQRAQMLLLYPVKPITSGELHDRVSTVDGSAHVFRTCCEKAGVPEDDLVREIDEGEADQIAVENMALFLAGIVDPGEISARLEKSTKSNAKGTGAGDTDAGESEDPEDDPANPSDPTTGDSARSSGGIGKTPRNASTDTSTTPTPARKRR